MLGGEARMEAYRFGVKFFVSGELPIPLKDFVPIFHGWIQKQNVRNHLLIDVHDYSHIHNGPGILLVAYEGNFSIDSTDGRPGLFYYRKQPLSGDPVGRLVEIMEAALLGCRLLEEDPQLAGALRFRRDEALIIANDRLLAPNVEQTFGEVQPIVQDALLRVLGPAELSLTSNVNEPQERFSIHATIRKAR
jgi:hypothetical protein